MDSSSMKGRLALAKFFAGLLSSKAHWYHIVSPSHNEPHSGLIRSTFPSLSDLLSFEDEICDQLLVKLGLVCYWRGIASMCSPIIHAWEMLIMEFDLHIEITSSPLKISIGIIFDWVHGKIGT
jgi:hypothetical protein